MTTQDLLPILLKVIDRCPKVRKIFVIELHPGLLKTKVTQQDFDKVVAETDRKLELITYNELLEIGKKISEEEVSYTSPKPDDVAVILYTSGESSLMFTT